MDNCQALKNRLLLPVNQQPAHLLLYKPAESVIFAVEKKLQYEANDHYGIINYWLYCTGYSPVLLPGYYKCAASPKRKTST
jgi:hypothetical protein